MMPPTGAALPSTVHVKVSTCEGSVADTLTVTGEVLNQPLFPVGEPTVTVTTGAVRSTDHVNAAGVVSVLWAASVARTWKECEPSPRPV